MWNSRLPIRPFAVLCGHEAIVCSVVVGGSGAVSVKGFSCLARLPLFWPLCWREQPFVAAVLLLLSLLSLSVLSSSLVCLCRLSFLGSWLLQLKVWDIWHRKKTEGTHHFVLPLVLRSLVVLPSSLHFAESYIYFIYGTQGFKLYLVGRIGKCVSTLSSQNQKSLYELSYKSWFLACVWI